jgi:hypothetical protein
VEYFFGSIGEFEKYYYFCMVIQDTLYKPCENIQKIFCKRIPTLCERIREKSRIQAEMDVLVKGKAMEKILRK